MKWDRRSRLLKISTYAIIICLILSVIFAGFTIYGNKVGNFILSVDQKSDVKLALSDREDMSGETARLAAKGLDEITLGTLSDVPRNVAAGIGEKNDALRHYMAYSFYLINHSDRSIDYTIDVRVLEAKQNVESVVRFMLLEGDAERGDVYAKASETGAPEEHTLENMERGLEPYTTLAFETDDHVATLTETRFGAGDVRKYTVVVWLEGEDAQATDEIKGGGIRMAITFTGY